MELTVTPKQAKEHITTNIRAGLVTMLHGHPGLGKSDIVKEIANQFKLKLIDFRATQMDPTDVNGFGTIIKEGNNAFARYVPFDVFPLEDTPVLKGYTGWLLFFDELNCHDDKTEIMTNEGFIKFSALHPGYQVAQYNQDTKEISYVKPSRYVDKHYTGNMVKVGGKGSSLDFCVTPNHEMLIDRVDYKRIKTKTFKILAQELTAKSYEHIPVAGKGSGNEDILSLYEKLAILHQADGSTSGSYTELTEEEMSYCQLGSKRGWETKTGLKQQPGHFTLKFGFNKQRKIKQFLEDFGRYTECHEWATNTSGYRHFCIRNVPPKWVNKDFTKIFDITTFSQKKAIAFLTYLVKWDGFKAGKGYGYSNTNKASIDFVQQVAVLAGYKANISVCPDNRKNTYNTCYKVHFYNKNYVTNQTLKRTLNKNYQYSGHVYCVTVPDGNIITRRNGKILIAGNSASKAVEAALYKVLLDRKIGQKNLHPKTAMVAAGNLATSGAIVNRQGTATQSRMVHLTLSADPIGWIEWASKNNIDFRVISYISNFPDKLHDFDPKHSDKTFSSPRTWHFLSRILKVTGDKPLKESLVNIAGTIGEGAARQFVSFSESLIELPSIKEIIANPFTTKVSDKPSLLHAVTHLIAAHLDEKNVDRVINYINRLPIEFQTICLQNAIHRNRELINQDVIQSWIIEKGELLL